MTKPGIVFKLNMLLTTPKVIKYALGKQHKKFLD